MSCAADSRRSTLALTTAARIICGGAVCLARSRTYGDTLGRPEPGSAEIPDPAPHRHRRARGLREPRAPAEPVLVAGHAAQHHVGPREARLPDPSPHQRGTDAHGRGLPGLL